MAIALTRDTFLQKVFDYTTQQDWNYVGDKPCVIDFWAEWCGPCRTLAPIFEELSKEYEGKVYFYKVDTEAEQELASVFGIRSIPSLLFIPMTGQPQMAMGALPKDALQQAVRDILLAEQPVEQPQP